MSKPYYIFSNGRIKRKDNTVFFEFKNLDEKDSNKRKTKRAIPVESIDSLFIFGEIDLNNKSLTFFSQNNVPLHFFNYYGYYTGTFFPRDSSISGHIIIDQVSNYLDQKKRFGIAYEIIESSNYNILKNLKYYNRRHVDLAKIISDIDKTIGEMKYSNSIEELMGYEGQIHRRYFEGWNSILKSETFLFNKRTRKPPENPVNALISFGNSLVYSVVLGEIYKTHLNPAVSFLHQPGTKRFSLSLDIAEIFKPIFSDRLIFSLINHKQINKKHFEHNLEFCYLNEKGRKIFTQQFDEKLKTTVKHPTLKRSVSYKQLVKLECYKLMKHILEEEEYKGFRMWW